MDASKIKEIFKQEKLVPILRTKSSEAIYHIAEAVQAGGGKVLEYTMTIQGIIKEIGKVKEKFPDLIIGLGTVYEKQDAVEAIKNGVDFIVSPILNMEIIDAVKTAGKMLVLSGLTPTEIYQAHKIGADLVNLYPASEMSPSYMRELLLPMPFVEIFPTGGLDLITSIQFLSKGAVAVGMGNTVFKRDLLEKKNFEEITSILKNAIHRIKNMEI
jgi:2-dehydro-3-deoxyphosphogluconate aldolase / (4S)-4-hydroxy-2-oxoglutarate aldolase